MGHVAAHELGAAAYAIRAARAAAPEGEGEAAGRLECQWQRAQLPDGIRDLVLDDQRAAQRAVLVRVRLLTRLAPAGAGLASGPQPRGQRIAGRLAAATAWP